MRDGEGGAVWDEQECEQTKKIEAGPGPCRTGILVQLTKMILGDTAGFRRVNSAKVGAAQSHTVRVAYSDRDGA